jgi:hypothetical protein
MLQLTKTQLISIIAALTLGTAVVTNFVTNWYANQHAPQNCWKGTPEQQRKSQEALKPSFDYKYKGKGF